jgi:hypothetical protein
MSGEGRKKDTNWDQVTIENDKAFCIFCKSEVSKKIGRIRKHLMECKKKMKKIPLAFVSFYYIVVVT